MGVIKKITDYLLRKGVGLLRIIVFVAKPTTKLNSIILNNKVDFRTINNQVLNDISIVRGKKKYNQLKKMLDKGACGISIYMAGELTAYGWVGLNKEKHNIRMFTTFAIPPNSAYIFECYTVEKFRGQKLYPAIVYNLVEWAKNQQVENVYIETVAGNINAEKGINKLGFECISLQTKVLLFYQVIFEYDKKR